MSSSLDLDQAGHFVKPDLGPNCLQISADSKSSSNFFRFTKVLATKNSEPG